MNTLKHCQNEGVLEIGIDEAGRGCLVGPVFIAGVILPNNIYELCEEEDIVLKDSKKMSSKNREIARDFIERVAIDYSVIQKDNKVIDEKNILQATLSGMHEVVDKIQIKPEKILVDGNQFHIYRDSKGDIVPHECVIEGDNTYISIASASILAKTYKDEYIKKLVEDNPDLNKYDLLNNSGYGTANHIEAIKIYGITEYHRRTFGLCKNY